MLISNAVGDNHADVLSNLFDKAEQAFVAVAFLKEKGADHIASAIERTLAEGGTAELFVGTDFFHTEPEALERLLDVAERHPACSVLVANRSAATFHPKIYAARRGDRWRTLVGSANLTQGALRSNEELSLLVEHTAADELSRQLNETLVRYRTWDRLRKLDRTILRRYRWDYEIDRRERQRYEKARDEALPHEMDMSAVADMHSRYRADPDTKSAVSARRSSRARALRIQRRIAALASKPLDGAARKIARDGLGDLMGSSGRQHLWGSGNIPRQGSKALRHPRKLIGLFALARKASLRSAQDGYAAMRAAADGIPGVGLNMATEMLCTFAPATFAIYNGNTAAALSQLGVDAPSNTNFRAIGPDRYARLCSTLKALGSQIGAADLSETDAFLNWVFRTVANAKA